MRLYLDLTKAGIVVFVLLTGLAGYGLSFAPWMHFSWLHLAMFVLGLYLISSGSCALNQAQEWALDAMMPRTQKRPIPSGQIKPRTVYILAAVFVVVGLALLNEASPMSALLGLVTVVLYNFFYTLYWKRRWAFGAVPGAIPGAMPVVIGFAANNPDILSPECIYVFFVMFLWQMPHFWLLAIRFRDDYAKGGVPVLPTQIGVAATLFHMGLYIFAYVALAVVSPWFVKAYFLYFVVVVPLALKVLYEFLKYYRLEAKSRWLPFFLWINLSVLVFVIAPVFDKWHILLKGLATW
jgi:protoheme IX farnesyltransferase